MIATLSSLATSLGLGVGAGVNAYATFLVFGLLSRFYPGLFHGDLASFFAQTPVLIVMGVLYSIEFVADKIPTIDHAWDVIHTFIRPLAGVVLAIATTSGDLPKGMVVFAAILSGGAALTSHAAKASLRATSTVATGGVANPVLSVIEDIFAVVGSIIAIWLPFVFIALLLVVFVPAVLILLRRVRARRPAQ